MQNYPRLQGFFWCLGWCVFISTERLYDRYWPKLQDLQSCPQDTERGRSRGSVSVHPSRSHLEMVAAAWKKPGHSTPLPWEGELIFLSACFAGLFDIFANRTKCISLPCATQRSPYFFQSSLTAVSVQVAVFYSLSSFLHCLASEIHSHACTSLQAWQPSATLTRIQRTALPSPQGRDKTSLPSSQSLTCP